MPNLSPQMVLPRDPPRPLEAIGIYRWVDTLATALGNTWREMIYVLNALSIVDTRANRSSTPVLDHILFTASDTQEAFVGVAGAWQPLTQVRLGGANGQLLATQQLTELHTLAAAGTSDTVIAFPAGSLGLGVSYRVTTSITGATTFDLGVAGATDRYFDDAALTGTGAVGAAHSYAASTPLRFTANGSNFTGGVVRVVLYYLALTAPTS